MADIPIFGKLVSTTTAKEIVNYNEVAGRPEVNPTGTATGTLKQIKIEDIIYSLSGLDMDKLNEVLAGYVKAGGGEEIVNSYQLPYNKALTLEPNSLYIIQGYDNSYNLADFIATGGTKDITSDMAVVMCGSDNNGTLDSLIVAKTGTITTSISTATQVTTITPTRSTIYLKYWQVKGLTIGGSVSGGGTYVEANPSGKITAALQTLQIDNTIYNIPNQIYAHNVVITGDIVKSGVTLYVQACLTIINRDYGEIDNAYQLARAIQGISSSAIIPCNGIGATSVISDGKASNVDVIYAVGYAKTSTEDYLRFYKTYGSEHADYIDANIDSTISDLKITDYVLNL